MSRSPSLGLFAYVQSYFTEYLPRQRGASVHTMHAYRDTLTLLFKCKPSIKYALEWSA